MHYVIRSFSIVFDSGVSSMIEAFSAYDFKTVIIVKIGYDIDKLCMLGKYIDTHVQTPVYYVILYENPYALLKILSKYRRASISII